MRRLLGELMLRSAADDGGSGGAADDEDARRAVEGAEEASKGGDDGDKGDKGEKDDGKQPWFMRRIARLSNERNELRRRAEMAEAAAERPAPSEDGDDDEDEDRRVQSLAEARAAQIVSDEELARRSNEVYDKGISVYPDFKVALQTFTLYGGLKQLNDEMGFLDALMQTSDPTKVLVEIGRDKELAEELLGEDNRRAPSPAAIARLTLKLDKIAGSRAKSKAPAPVTPVGGRGPASPDGLGEEVPIDTWMQRRQKEVQQSGRRRLRGY